MNSQKQHRVSQVYLKQFGCKDQGNKNIVMLSSPENPNPHKHHIKNLTAEENFWGMPEGFGKTDNLENKCGQIETYYPNLIKEFEEGNFPLSGKSQDLIRHFIASLLGRSYYFHNMLKSLYYDNETRDKFINEIFIFSNESAKNELVTHLTHHSCKLAQIDFITCG